MGGNWPYSGFFVGFCFQEFFKSVCNIIEYFPSSFFSIHFVRAKVVQTCSSTDTATAWKKFRFIPSER